MEEGHGGQHTHHITQTNHGVSHAEGEVLDDIHPEDVAERETDTTTGKLPVDEQSAEIAPCPGEVARLLETKLHQHLSTRQQ